jgi:hypothetical protein
MLLVHLIQQFHSRISLGPQLFALFFPFLSITHFLLNIIDFRLYTMCLVELGLHFVVLLLQGIVFAGHECHDRVDVLDGLGAQGHDFGIDFVEQFAKIIHVYVDFAELGQVVLEALGTYFLH